MATDDTCVSIHPYFAIQEGELENVRSYLERFVELTKSEPGCVYYGFTLCDDKLHCREAYASADAVLAHLGNVGGLLKEMLDSGKATLTDLQIHGPEQELAKLREPLADFNPSYWVLEYGFRNQVA